MSSPDQPTSQQGTGAGHTRLIVIGAVIAALCFGALNLAEPIARWVGRTGINIGTRLMGLMLAALAVEFIVDGLKALLPNLK